MKISPAPLLAQDLYKLLTGIVVPRPIAWVTSRSGKGVVNLAPFSCFTFVSSKPPMVGINVGRRLGERKDTAVNIEFAKEFVVNIGDETMIEDIHRTGIAYPPHVSEVEVLGLEIAECEYVKVPRLAAAPISLECRLHQTLTFGETGAQFIVGEVVLFHIRDGLSQNYKIDTAKLRPVCRVGGPNYASLGEIVSMQHVGDVRTGPG
jgi:flavin reductase (DIM6/NTAB) family NADH-FMN oxidoreductase RutF